MQVSFIKSIDKRQLWNTFEISSNTSLFADFFKASVSSSSAKTRARYFNSVSVHVRSFFGAGFLAIFLLWALFRYLDYANTFCILMLKDRWLYVSRCWFRHLSSSVAAFIHRRIIRPDGLSTLVRLPRRTKQIVRLDGWSICCPYLYTDGLSDELKNSCPSSSRRIIRL